MGTRTATAAFVVALALGAAIRVAVLPIRVASVDDSWRAWSYYAATIGPAQMYGPRGHTVVFGGIDVPVVYPPLALDELGVVGRIYSAVTGGFDDDNRLTIALKGTIVLFEAALAVLLYAAIRRAGGTRAAQLGCAAYWMNPAALATTSLGYIDALFALPATAAVVAASDGRARIAGALLVAAIATKPQGVFVAPVVALALWNAGNADGALARWRSAGIAGAFVATVLAAPFVAAGTAYYMVRSVAVLAGHNMLSAWAFNAWWLVSYGFAAAQAAGGGARAALSAQPQILEHAYAVERGFPHPRIVAVVLLGSAVVWALRAAHRARDLGLQAALGAFIVTAYFTLSVQVHENHFFLALPLLAMAAALRREFRAVAAALSVTFALNLLLTLGWTGREPPARALTFAVVDTTVLIAAVNCGLLAWLGAMLARASRPELAPRSGKISPTHG